MPWGLDEKYMIRLESKTKEEAAEKCYTIVTMGFGENMEFSIFENVKREICPKVTTFNEEAEKEVFLKAFMEGGAATGVADYKGGRYSFGWAPELNGILVNFVDEPVFEKDFLDALYKEKGLRDA